MGLADVDQNTFPKELNDDKAAHSQMSDIAQQIYDQLKKDQATGQTQQASFDRSAASKFLQDTMLLPGITIVGIDETNDKNGTGLQITDTGTGKEEHYTLDPTTGFARSESGALEAIYYPDGKVQRFDYQKDANGNYVLENGKPKLTDVVDAAGTTWHINPDGTADYTDKNKNKGHSDGKFSIDQKTGEITITDDKKGTKEIHQPDGSMVRTNKDGQVTDIQFPFDQSTGNQRGAMHFDYKGKELTGVVDQSGQKWDKVDGKWQTTRTGADGNSETVVSTSDFSVTNHNSVLIKNSDGSIEEYFSNGGKVKQTPVMQDGKPIGYTSIGIDKNNEITSIESPGSKNRNIKWEDGKPILIDVQEGQWTQDKPGHWVLKDKSGKQVSDADGVKVMPDGAVVVFNSDGSQDVVAPDGKKTHKPANGPH